jgi:cytochrome c oxidase subunit IV
MSEHIVSRGLYLTIGVTLLVLTALTVSAAMVNLGPFNAVVALAIATIKALLVVLFFMHVKYTSEKMTRMVLLAGVFWLLLLLVLTLSDYGSRTWS